MPASVDEFQPHAANIYVPPILENLCGQLSFRFGGLPLSDSLVSKLVRQNRAIENGDTLGVIVMGIGMTTQVPVSVSI